MTHHIIKCPHCGKTIECASGSLDRIGSPFRQCPYCRGICEDLNTKEWITRTPEQRRMLIISKPFAFALLSSFFIGGFVLVITNNFVTALITAVISFIIIFILGILIFKAYIKESVDNSLQRTKSASYVQLLKKTGYHIYPIKGIDVGTIEDFEIIKMPDTDDIKTEKDITYSHH